MLLTTCNYDLHAILGRLRQKVYSGDHAYLIRRCSGGKSQHEVRHTAVARRSHRPQGVSVDGVDCAERASAYRRKIFCQSPANSRWLSTIVAGSPAQDDRSYIELLGDYWGELCVTPELASSWADEFKPVVESAWGPSTSGYVFFKGTTACLASLYAADRHQELLALIDKAPFKWCQDRRWGVKALSAMGNNAEAIRYAEDSRGLNDPGWQIAQACEAILLSDELATRSPTDPRTLTRAARDFAEKQPDFALAAGLASLQWISRGHGYEITGSDVLATYAAVVHAASNAGIATEIVNAQIIDIYEAPAGRFLQTTLARQMSN